MCCTAAHAPRIASRRCDLNGAPDAAVGTKKATVETAAATMAREVRYRMLSPKRSDLAESYVRHSVRSTVRPSHRIQPGRRRVVADQRPMPPGARLAAFSPGGEPVLVDQRADG